MPVEESSGAHVLVFWVFQQRRAPLVRASMPLRSYDYSLMNSLWRSWVSRGGIESASEVRPCCAKTMGYSMQSRERERRHLHHSERKRLSMNETIQGCERAWSTWGGCGEVEDELCWRCEFKNTSNYRISEYIELIRKIKRIKRIPCHGAGLERLLTHLSRCEVERFPLA